MKKNNVYILEDRGLLYVSGDDVKESVSYTHLTLPTNREV